MPSFVAYGKQRQQQRTLQRARDALFVEKCVTEGSGCVCFSNENYVTEGTWCPCLFQQQKLCYRFLCLLQKQKLLYRRHVVPLFVSAMESALQRACGTSVCLSNEKYITEVTYCPCLLLQGKLCYRRHVVHLIVSAMRIVKL